MFKNMGYSTTKWIKCPVYIGINFFKICLTGYFGSLKKILICNKNFSFIDYY